MSMDAELKAGVPIVRIFRARAKPGKESQLASKLATTSADLVRVRPGLVAYLAGGPGHAQGSDFLFITIWRHFHAMKELFGEQWRMSLLPPGYEELIETHSVEHYELAEHLFRQ